MYMYPQPPSRTRPPKNAPRHTRCGLRMMKQLASADALRRQGSMKPLVNRMDPDLPPHTACMHVHAHTHHISYSIPYMKIWTCAGLYSILQKTSSPAHC